jgi:hypothetical protein
MTRSQGRAYLVFLGDASSPHGYVWLTADRVKPGCTWSATAAGTARAVYRVGPTTAIRVQEATRLCSAIKRRRDALERARGGYYGLEPFADSYRAVLAARQTRILKRAGLWHVGPISPGGTGLL